MISNKQIKIFKIAFPPIAILLLVFLFVISAPQEFPMNKIITIPKGATLKEIAANFQEEKLIRYPVLFDSLMRYSGHEKDIKAGKYIFEKRLSAIGLMQRLIIGDHGIPTIKITVPEGSTINDINRIFGNAGFENFGIKDKELEGYLFPDTYFFLADNTPIDAVTKMTENLKSKTIDLEADILKSKRNFHQILTMASLLEKEAATTKDRKMIAGILWKRIDKKMLLQVDSTLDYVLDKNTFELTTEDLKTNSPYNTYKRLGLPPTPICNPGLDAIKAALYPEQSLYWYYLSDKKGNVYYSKTFAEHVAKKQKYLR